MTPISADQTGWLRRFGFRFGCVYLFLQSIDGLNSILFNFFGLGHLWGRMWNAVVPWVAENVLRLGEPVRFHPSGSGDTLFDWVRVWCLLVLAFVTALVWAQFDRARKRDVVVHEVMRVIVRYVLASALLTYGLIKILSTQFPPPSLDRLVEPYGHSSPMGLLWTFMGASRPYEIFSGLAETLAGLLLFFRRTTTLGAIVTVGVMTNVVLLNFCYDVPVKLYSAHLLLCAVWLLLPAARRLANLFLLNRPVEPAPLARPWPDRVLANVVFGLKVAVLGWVLFLHTVPVWQNRFQARLDGPKPALYGLYQVTEFTYDRPGKPLPPLLRDNLRWRYVSVNQFIVLMARCADGARETYPIKPEPGHDAFTIETGGRKKQTSRLTYRRPAPDELVIEGELRGTPLFLHAHAVDLEKFTLTNRGFHWVNEYPPNW